MPVARILGREVNRFWLIASIILLFPLVAGDYLLHVGILVLIASVVASGWNILVLTGQLSLGQAGFFGLGAYTAALMFQKLGWPPLVGMAAGALVASLAAVILGQLTLRMRGIYLAITTLAFAEALRVLVVMLPELTGGAVGVTVPPLFGGDRVAAYYLIAGLALGSALLHLVITRMPLYYAFVAIRGNEESAGVLGVNLTRYKVIAFTLSALVTGLAGGFYSFYVTYIVPETVFNIGISVEAQLGPLVGGLYTVTGPILGAVFMTGISEYLRTLMDNGHMVFYGLTLVVFVLALPQGLNGLIDGALRRHLHGPEPGGEPCALKRSA